MSKSTKDMVVFGCAAVAWVTAAALIIPFALVGVAHYIDWVREVTS